MNLLHFREAGVRIDVASFHFAAFIVGSVVVLVALLVCLVYILYMICNRNSGRYLPLNISDDSVEPDIDGQEQGQAAAGNVGHEQGQANTGNEEQGLYAYGCALKKYIWD